VRRFKYNACVVKIQPSPTANFSQSFCISQNAALSNLVIGGQNIK
jgi:hypothetical protein